MKARDLKAGVVYAYGLGDYDNYDAVVLLDVGDPAEHRQPTGDTVYLAARVPSEKITPEVLDGLRNPQVLSAVRSLGYEYVSKVTHRMVRGEWDKVIAEREARRAGIAQRRAAEQAVRDEKKGREQERWQDTADKLAVLGVSVERLYDDRDDLVTDAYLLGKDDADALIRRLGGEQG